MKVEVAAPQVGLCFVKLLQTQETAVFHVGSGLKTL
jgi:hypothetical protein